MAHLGLHLFPVEVDVVSVVVLVFFVEKIPRFTPEDSLPTATDVAVSSVCVRKALVLA